MTWKAAIASAIGTRHQQQQRPCQDYGQYLHLGPILIAAIADGAGSARRADLGAKLAVETTLQELRSQVENPILCSSATVLEPYPPDYEAEQGLIQPASQMPPVAVLPLFTTVVTAVVSALHQQAEQGNYPLTDLSATLLAVVATPDWLAAMQIGDGFVVVESATTELELLFQPAKGEYINETCFVTSPAVLEQMQIRLYPHPPRFICAATDGLERLAIRFQDWTPFPPFFQPLAHCLQTDAQGATAYLETFLACDRLNARTDDDKTLFMGLFEPESAP